MSQGRKFLEALRHANALRNQPPAEPPAAAAAPPAAPRHVHSRATFTERVTVQNQPAAPPAPRHVPSRAEVVHIRNQTPEAPPAHAPARVNMVVHNQDHDNFALAFEPSEIDILSTEFLDEINNNKLQNHSAAELLSPMSSAKSSPASSNAESQNMFDSPMTSPASDKIYTSAKAVQRVKTRLFKESPTPKVLSNLSKVDFVTPQAHPNRIIEQGLNYSNWSLSEAVNDSLSPVENFGTTSTEQLICSPQFEPPLVSDLTPLSNVQLADVVLGEQVVGQHQITPDETSEKVAIHGERVKKVLFHSVSTVSSEPAPLNNEESYAASNESGSIYDRVEDGGKEGEDEPLSPPLTTVIIPEEPHMDQEIIINTDQVLEVPAQPVQENIQGKKRKRQSVISESTPPKKRRVDKTSWKASKAKLAYNSGDAHTTARGKERQARELKPGCGASCRKKCIKRITPELRQYLFNKYYGLQDKSLQWYMIARMVVPVPVKQRKAENEDREQPYRKRSYDYNLTDLDGTKIPVCQTMFLHTFDISISVVFTALSKNSPDKRGKHGKPKKRLAAELVQNVKDHIKEFPTVESHYCREDSRRRYLEENLSTAKMHRLYLMERGGLPNTATLRQYRDIFNTCFNLSFFKPKKDQCAQCVQWERLTPDEKEKTSEKYKEHIENKNAARKLKKEDKETSINEEEKLTTGKNIRVLTFDLQKVLYCPKSEVGEFFYKRKLSTYNFTIFDCSTGQGYCFCWDQTVALRGSDEISSCVLMYFEEAVTKGVNEFRIYSDSCSGQNKNQFLYSMYYLASRKFNIRIVHRYLEKGHTQMECDSVHAQIEKKTRHTEIFTPSQWYGFIKSAKVQKPAYILKEIDQKTIFSFKTVAEPFSWSKVPISKICEIVFDCSSPGSVSYKLQFGEPSTTKTVLLQKRGRPINWQTLKLQPAYSAALPLKPKLVEDLKWYLKKNLIPAASIPFYNSLVGLPVSEEIDDDVPQEVSHNVELFEENEDDADAMME